ncbi:MAG: hypothetical protein COV72_02090 [Candidatus Omnitrophica bacterium CG11_big_fil_rev_8_21_14_0_20_42_13]|uniref:Glycosyltransferase 2-like domain-containing protein n=1 Tax=Candidatus Ghiorseimicrobium undicola TaxID=1974746 RepID=A0A2H0LZ46_9BACT|nr:MAG: hypothetical protein COV72_02090 [Candidatus Omnitrophica bacterium CG11_big_fil_rev_8_21_14_0_20_42_13]
MKLSIVIPVHNEEEGVLATVGGIIKELEAEKINHEIIIVDDNSSDSTPKITDDLSARCPNVKVVHRGPPNGFGRAIQEGLRNTSGDAVGIVMGDSSDDPKDIVGCFRKIEEGYDCVFGSRFLKGSIVKDYPLVKLLINRLANNFIRMLFLIKANDITNAFKLYRREVIRAVMPLQALYFNITVEIPLKALVRGFSYAQIPIRWYGRKSGVSKLGIRQMGRKYLFTVLYVWLEKLLLKDEVKRR